jgi:lipoprotein-anchoring transpeptidase ErfK/SrfK
LHKTSLILLAIGLAGFSVKADAQYYQPAPYQPSGAYRALPFDDDDDGPDIFVPPPGAPAPRGSAYEVQPLPPPGTYVEPPVAVAPGPYAPPPVAAPPPVGPPREAYGYPADEPAARPGPVLPGRSFGWEPIRPPGDIGAPRTIGPGYAPAPGYAPVGPAPHEGPTGAISAPREAAPAGNRAYAALPPDYRPEEGKPKQLSPHLQRQLVDYTTTEPAGTIVIDTPNTFLYLVLGNGKAMRYGIGVGREGFTWSGVERVTKMAEWPDWHPPPEMIERQPYLPRFMAGGESSPLGARALYLGKTIYRIHGTNQPSTIGTFVSSGCIRLVNADIEDLYQRVNVGTRVVVLPGKAPSNAQGSGAGSAQLPASSQVIR